MARDWTTNRLEKLIQDVLISQKIDLKKLSITKSKINTSNIIDDMYNSFLSTCELKNVKLVKKETENYQIYSDPDRINQIFSNLITNALEFVPKKDAEIQIGSVENDESIEFFVKDNGQGISENEQKIFSKNSIK